MTQYWPKRVVVAAVPLFLVCVTLLAKPVSAQPGSGPDQMIIKDFDKDGDGVLNTSERQAALKSLASGGGQQRRRGRGPGGGGQQVAGKPGPKVKMADAKRYPDATLYDQTVLRTLFLEFESDNWEKELAAFKPTDVEVPAKLTVDGKAYPNVGVSFRGASSFFMIPEGLKRSLNLSIDFMDSDQRLYGYKSLNLLNCNGDATMMSSILYSNFAGKHVETPKVNYVKVVINGQSWGLYVSSQQFNKIFLKENFDTSKGARWKVNGNPRADGGLRYLGEDIEPYRERFDIKSKDKESSWRDLINFCKVLNRTPADQIEQALEPLIDIDSLLWFLAVDVALVNSDGYWTRASDYSIYKDPDGKFHILPHDMNEAFKSESHGGPGGGSRGRNRGGQRGGGPPGGGPQGGRGQFGGPPGGGPPPGDGGPDGPPPGAGGPGGGLGGGGAAGGGGVELDPLVGLNEERMPLRSVVLNNPKWQRQYLENLRTIAEMLQWKNLGPTVKQYRTLIQDEVALDTRKLFATSDFRKATADSRSTNNSTSLRMFAEKRSKFLLNHAKIKRLGQ